MIASTSGRVLNVAEESAETSTEYTDKKKARSQVPPSRPGKSATKVLFLSITKIKGERKWYSLTQGEPDE